MFERLARDFRYSVRRLARNPGFTLIAILSLAIGIGANTAIFSIVNSVMLQKPNLERPDELVEIYYGLPGFPYAPWSYADYADLKAGSGDLLSQLSLSKITLAARDLGDRIDPLLGELVTGDYFPILGLPPTAGRLLGPEDDVEPGGHPVVVLGYAYWQSAFEGDPAVIGTELRLNGRNYQVVGVAPANWKGNLRGMKPSVYLPMTMSAAIEPDGGGPLLENRGAHSYFMRGRLAAGATIPELETRLAAFRADMVERYPDDWRPETTIPVVPTSDVIMNPSVDAIIRPVAALLLAVVGLVLLIACANLASFLLARAVDRRREIAVRLALGAGRGGLIRQLLIETVTLSLIAGAAGVGIAWLALQGIAGLELPFAVPIDMEFPIDATVLGFTMVVSLAAGILFGLAPALQSTNPDVAPTLKDEGTGGGRPRRFTLRKTLVAGQVAVSTVVLVAAGLFLRSFQERADVDPGFGENPAVVLQFGLSGEKYTDEEADQIRAEMLDRIRARPDVVAAGVTTNMHLDVMNTSWTTLQIEGVDPPPDRDGYDMDAASVGPDFFRAMGIPIVQGRAIEDQDREGAAPVVVINQAFADRFWPGEAALGRTVRRNDEEFTVVGVAASTKVRTLGEPSRSFVYFSQAQRTGLFQTLVARTRGPADGVVVPIMGILRELDPDVLIYSSTTMSDFLSTQLLPARLGAFALLLFAGLALGLAVIGLYGVVSYAVASRSREVGIRMSLGADVPAVVRMLMGDGLRLAGIGAGVGIVLAFMLSQGLRSLLFGVPALDPVTFLGVPALLLGFAVLAAWLPARRAGGVEPVKALKSE